MIEAVLSDLDGTLIDTTHLIREGLYLTARQYLETEKQLNAQDIPSYEQVEPLIRDSIGGSARESLELLVKAIYKTKSHILEGVDYEIMHDLLNPIQDRLAPEAVIAYPGLEELLSYIGKSGIKLAIYTAGTPHHVARNIGIALPSIGCQELYQDESIDSRQKLAIVEAALRKAYGLDALTIVTCEDVSETKPNPEGLVLAMKRLQVADSNTLAIGDFTADMQAAQRAGITTRIGITHGFDDSKLLLQSGATGIVESLEAFRRLLKDSLN